ncbi:protein SEMI-ROLLED LEAF 2 isoform X2 [Nicotiana tomentosiformis]|uniref:protein SEMI-ROLLED LEAF 2 isoform X2 n=1 Tax=Nicotiana tomentosiformis TaxID=4098 RepID=UPI00051B4B4D|nr:protein SEMI-ROLLED LEAF 2 isoform X2 [Nicotiana tomentosiformis]
MNGVSGVISRQVLPACGNLCFFCPAMRTRSRQPVKRYKKLISDIFPRSQEEEPNDRKIGKLCEYAAKNPFRIPKITKSLEERCYKELRNENFRSAKVVMCIYKKLVVSCKEHMPLFANSLLSIIQTLLDQSRENDMLIVGCEALFDFVNNQKDGTYMFHLDGFIPKLCQLAQQIGEEESAKHLHTVGLKALSAMVWFMGEYSHVSAEFDNIVSVVLENYPRPRKETQDSNQNRWVEEVRKVEGHVSPSPDVIAKVPSWRIIVNEKGELNISKEDAENPSFWSRICLHNIAKLGKEATTTRRVLESLFCYFDDDNLWPTETGIALPILKDMQYTMDASGENAHLLLSILVKHLDHKNVLKQPEMQLDIVQVVTSLAQTTKIHHSMALVSAVTDIMRHLRKSIHYTLDDAKLGAELIKWNRSFQEAVDECLVELSNKVGDAGPILDVMAVMLENISSIKVIARTTIAAAYRASQIIASMPNLSYQNKAFPEALFHQLLPAMVHPDHETRVGAHRIFSVVLVPSSVSPQKIPEDTHQRKATDFSRALSRTVSVFSSSAALFGKLRDQRSSSAENITLETEQKDNNSGMLNRIKSTYSGVYNTIGSPAPVGECTNKSSKEAGPKSLRLSSHQIVLLLSSLWVQSISPANMPENYEAIAHTFSLVLLFSRAKHSYREALVQSFQLAFSLRNVALVEGGSLPPSRKRSLFVLATSMILFSSKAYNIPSLIPCVKATLSDKTVDPFLHLVEDSKLQAADSSSGYGKVIYGSKEDDSSAQKCLSQINITEEQSTESLVSLILKSLSNLPDFEVSATREELLKEFSPDDSDSLGSQFLADAQHRVQQSNSVDLSSILDDDGPDLSQSSSKQNEQSAMEIPNLLSVNQLLESVLETAHQVGRISLSNEPDFSYKEMTHHCETLLTGKQQRMYNLMNSQHRQDSALIRISQNSSEQDKESSSHNQVENQVKNQLVDQKAANVSQKPSPGTVDWHCGAQCQSNPETFRLPASSPYDNFLKAAGW